MLESEETLQVSYSFLLLQSDTQDRDFSSASLTDGQSLFQLLQWGSSQEKIPKGYDEMLESTIQTGAQLQ